MELQFVTVIIWLYYLSPTVCTCSHDQDPCGDFQPFYEMALRGHVFKTLNVPNSLYCLKECKKEARCQSLNHLMGKDTCELNDRTKEARPDDFITDITKLYLKNPKNRVPLGSIPELPAVSCKEIKMSEGQAVSGKYWLSSIKPNTAALAHCNMKTEDADECTASIHVCEENADGCKNTLGSYICICKPGFTDNDRTCEDIDECAAGIHNCSSYAVCNNTKGSYNCSCNPGYSGNGLNCTDIDECDADTHNCSSDAVCTNTKGSYNCTCKPGHTGNGHNCTDIDECDADTHNCSSDAVCTNTKGSYNCTCKPGHTGNGHNCTDINECEAETHNCSANAICNNTKGSLNCTCKPGYTGDGHNCTDADECSTNSHSCDVNAVCTNTQGSYTCVCKAQYSGDGKTCMFTGLFKAVFTNLGATGRLGPTSLGSYYNGQDHDGQVTLVSGIQQWTVPQTGDYRIEAIGAAGGYDIASNGGQYRGRGARMKGTFHLSKGETIQILVGQEGGINYYHGSSGGGGGTFVVRGSNTPLITAGGGGGIERVKTRRTGCDASTGTAGRAGYNSWSGGSGGHGAQTADSSNSGGGGGGFYSNGRSSTQFGGSMGNGGEGGKGFLQGGVGGRAWYNNAVGGFGGGGGAYGADGGAGGGGGYSGGSSGQNIHGACGGGGGSYNVGKNQQNECCYNTAGHGQVTITLI